MANLASYTSNEIGFVRQSLDLWTEFHSYKGAYKGRMCVCTRTVSVHVQVSVSMFSDHRRVNLYLRVWLG